MMTDEIRALLFTATQNNRLSRALAADLMPLVELLGHAYRLGFVRGRSEIFAAMDRVPDSIGGDEPAELPFELLGQVRDSEMHLGDVGALVDMLARAYELGVRRGAAEAAAHVDGPEPSATLVDPVHVRRFETELRLELELFTPVQ